MANWTGTSENDIKLGSAKADRFYGLEGDDTLSSDGGIDLLVGGAGADVLTGGTSKDTFAYTSASDSGVAAGSSDVITDFNASENDKIDLSALGAITWGGNAALGGGTASAWYTTSASGASLFVDLDGSGTADMRIELEGVTRLTHANLIGVSKPVALPPTLPTEPPSATASKPDTAGIAEDSKTGLVSGNVLSNDGTGLKITAMNGHELSASTKAAAVKGEYGSIVISQTGKWTYTLDNSDADVQALGAGETRTETFTYVVAGKNGATATSTLTVTITGTNDRPVAVADTASTDGAAAITIAVLANDTDADLSDTLTVTSAKVPRGQGSATVNSDGTITYDPAGAFDALGAGETREVVITYTISDGKSTATSKAIVTVTGKPGGGVETNEAPVAQDGSASGDEDAPAITGTVAATDADGDALTYSLVEGPLAEQGTLTFQADGSYSFVPAKDFAGTVEFQFVAKDGAADGEPATVTITVGAVNDAPVATDGIASGDEGTTITGQVGGTDVEGDALTYKLVAPVEGLTFSPNGSYSYAAPKNASSLTFEYVANDGELDSAPKSVTISIGAVNDAPVATAIEDQTFDEDQEVAFTVPAFTDGDGDALAYTATMADGAALPTWLEFDATTRSFTGTPPADFQAALEITVTGSDGEFSAADTFTLTIAGINDPPAAQNGTAAGDEDAAEITGTVTATDADGDSLTYELIKAPSAEHGKLSFNTDGSYSFVPAQNFNGPASFTYRANDGSADSKVATLTITIAAVNDAPVATGGDASGDEGTTITGQVGGADVEGDTLTYKLVAPVEGLTLNEDGSYSYGAPKGATSASFEYVVNDGTEDSAPKSVTISIGAVNEAPVAKDSLAEGQEDAPAITGSVAATDEDGDSLTYAVHGEAPAGLAFHPDGSYSYTPAKDFAGEVTFQVVADDGELKSEPKSVTITVAAVNDAPVATGGDASGDEGTTITGQVGGTDIEGDALTYKLVSPVEGLILNEDGSYSYAAPKNATSASFEYVVNDGTEDSAPKSVTISIGAVNEAPVAQDGIASGDEDAPAITGTVSGTDADGDTLTYELVEAPPAEQGTLAFNPDGSYSFVPAKDFNGPASFTYKANDGTVDSNVATVRITVAAMDEPPTVPADVTITASTSATSFVGGAGDGDTLVFPGISGTQMLAAGTVSNVVVSLDGAITGGLYNGRTISEIENLTFEDVRGSSQASPRTLTINGNGDDNIINVKVTAKADINAGGGNDTINYVGVGAPALASVMSGGTGNDSVKVGTGAIIDDRAGSGLSGDDTYDLGGLTSFGVRNTAVQTLYFGADNGNDTVKGFSFGAASDGITPDSGGSTSPDVIDLAAAGIQANDVTVEEVNGNTVFTINGSTVTVEDVTGLTFGTHWFAEGTYTPPGGEEPPAEPGISIEQTGDSTQVEEGGATDTIRISLASAPTADVTVVVQGDYFQVASNPDDPYGDLQLTFTPGNWNLPQTVTVTALDDTEVEEAGTGGLYVSTIGSADPRYNYLYPANGFVSVSVTDNDTTVNSAPVVENVTINLTEDALSEAIDVFVSDPDGDPTTVRAVGELPAGVTFDATNQRFVFDGDPAVFDAMNDGDVETISFQYVANDGTEDSAPGTITINIAGITDETTPRIDPEPAQFADPYNYDQGTNGNGASGQRTANADIINDGAGLSSTINGFGGDDTIYGKDANDTLVGGMGNDTLHGGSGDDTINGDAGGSGGANTGFAGPDWLYGGDGNDTINGQDGSDILVGGHGADILNGGLGDDTFVFHDIFDRGDTITMQASAAADDRLDFRGFDFGPNEDGRQGPVDGLQLVNEAPVEGRMLEDMFYYNASTGRLSLNTGSDGLEDFHVTLALGAGTRPAQLAADDFLI